MFDQISDKFHAVFKNLRGKGKISEKNIEDALQDIRNALLEADVNFKVVKDFISKVKEKSLGEKVLKGVDPGEQFVKIVHSELAEVMGGEASEIDFDRTPLPVLVVGLNGQGKTTFCGKLSLYLKEKNKKNVLLVPADTFRPAAKEQLRVLATQVGVDLFDSDLSSSPKEIALAAMEEAKTLRKDVVIIDTAGRLHVDKELMGHLQKVRKGLAAYNPEVLMVADAMTGQEAVNVAKTFHQQITLSGVVLSKMDSDARGGAALSIRQVAAVPIRYISTGERMKDLEIFHPDRMAGRILEMGDVVSLVEKAQDEIDEKEAERMAKRLQKGRFSIDDFIKQMDMIKNMGPMSGILKMIPGMAEVVRQGGDLSSAEGELKNMRVISSSMTREERDDHTIIKSSRIERIARGSGTSTKMVEKFLFQFRQMEKMMGGMMGTIKSGGMGALTNMMRGGGIANIQAAGKKFKKSKGKSKGPWGKSYF